MNSLPVFLAPASPGVELVCLRVVVLVVPVVWDNMAAHLGGAKSVNARTTLCPGSHTSFWVLSVSCLVFQAVSHHVATCQHDRRWSLY